MKSSDNMKEEIEDFPEINVYFVINEIGGFIWRMNHDMGDGRIPEEHWPAIDKDIKRLGEVQHHAVSLLTKFGIAKPFRDDGKSPSAEYWAWFRWWDSYIKGLSEDQWKVLNALISSKSEVGMYRPEGDWRTSVPEEEKKIKEAEEYWKRMEK